MPPSTYFGFFMLALIVYFMVQLARDANEGIPCKKCGKRHHGFICPSTLEPSDSAAVLSNKNHGEQAGSA